MILKPSTRNDVISKQSFPQLTSSSQWVNLRLIEEWNADGVYFIFFSHSYEDSGISFALRVCRERLCWLLQCQLVVSAGQNYKHMGNLWPQQESEIHHRLLAKCQRRGQWREGRTAGGGQVLLPSILVPRHGRCRLRECQLVEFFRPVSVASHFPFLPNIFPQIDRICYPMSLCFSFSISQNSSFRLWSEINITTECYLIGECEI